MIASAKEIATLNITLFNSRINFANIHFCNNYCTKIFVNVVNTCVYRHSVDNKALIYLSKVEGLVSKYFVLALQPQFGLKIRGGGLHGHQLVFDRKFLLLSEI